MLRRNRILDLRTLGLRSGSVAHDGGPGDAGKLSLALL